MLDYLNGGLCKHTCKSFVLIVRRVKRVNGLKKKMLHTKYDFTLFLKGLYINACIVLYKEIEFRNFKIYLQ